MILLLLLLIVVVVVVVGLMAKNLFFVTAISCRC
jgi:hypothetical protein